MRGGMLNFTDPQGQFKLASTDTQHHCVIHPWSGCSMAFPFNVGVAFLAGSQRVNARGGSVSVSASVSAAASAPAPPTVHVAVSVSVPVRVWVERTTSR
eukprot:5837934-Alexandrium_andersonii.AAC.1